MNVALCAPGEIYGGVERFVHTLATYLRDETDVRPLVVLFEEGTHSRTLREAGVETVVIQPRWKYDVLVIRKLVHLFKTREIDVVHTSGYKATILATAAAKLCGIGTVKTEHGRLEPGNPYSVGHLRMRFNLLADRTVTHTCVDHVVYVTHDLKSCMLRNGKAGRSSVIHNGIVPIHTDAHPFPSDIDRNAFNIGIVGRLDEVKGHRSLLAALTRLSDLPRIAVNVIGEGALRSELERYSRQEQLTGRVKFLGFRENIHDYMRAFDVLAMPSLYEGLPYTLLEGMYLRRPVIASNVGGLREVLQDKVDALLVEPGNVDRLAEAIRYLYQNDAERTHLAENARRKICERFMISTMAEQYIEVFHRVSRKSDTERRTIGVPRQEIAMPSPGHKTRTSSEIER